MGGSEALVSLLTLVSLGLLAAILLWTIYQVPILFAGLRRGRRPRPKTPVARWPKVSLIVPAKDEEAVIARCLDALLSLDYPRDQLEILVVDGRSTDATRRICYDYSNQHPRLIRVLMQDASRGKPPALNLALPYATGEIVGFFDADSMPERDALRRAVAYFQDPSVVAVQGRPLSLNEGENMLTRVAAKEDKTWFQILLQGRERLRLFIPLTGSCQFLRRRVLEELGGWDEASLAEDVEFSLMLLQRGRSVRYAPDVCWWQQTPNTLRRLITQRTRWYRGFMEALLKHGSLLTQLTRKAVDAEVLLLGPYVMTLCLASYLNWALNLLLVQQAPGLQIIYSALAVVLTAVPLILVGTALAFMEKPVTIRNLLWIPFIYAYWLIQTLIAGWAFLQIVLRRPKTWQRTAKSRLTATHLPSMGGVG
jgi:cellulose synthase/poly-beta-1,6-N-acetylglucosamine synthase-like glycosyltransferase